MRRNKIKVFGYFFLEVDILHIILLEDQVSLHLQQRTQKLSVDTAHRSTHVIHGQILLPVSLGQGRHMLHIKTLTQVLVHERKLHKDF